MTAPKPEGQAQELLLQEFKEAWAHYRHIENTRAAYLGYVVTAVFGVLALVGNAVKSEPPLPHWIVFSALLLLDVLCTYVYGSIRKLRSVLREYEGTISRVRQLVYKDTYAELNRVLSVRESADPAMTLPFFSVQSAAEGLLVLFQTALGVILLVGPFVFSDYRVPSVATLLVLAAAFVICQLRLA